MTPYAGNGDYCYANSLYMCLRGGGAPVESLPAPSFLQCLTTMPFGNVYLKEAGLYFFDGDAPDVGLPRAIESLGWTCQVERGGDEQTALQRLRTAIEHGPVLLGPLDMGYLTFNPNYRYNGGSDH